MLKDRRNKVDAGTSRRRMMVFGVEGWLDDLEAEDYGRFGKIENSWEELARYMYEGTRK